MYKCYACGKQFIGGIRLNSEDIWLDYCEGKQTYKQLAKKYKCSQRTIQRKIDFHRLKLQRKEPISVIVLIVTTYWGNNFGVMVFIDAITKEVLLKYYIKSETNYLYKKGIKELQDLGFTILAIVCDRRRVLLLSFNNIPVQMCQFHQAAIIRRYLTKRPRMPASVELKGIVSLMTKTDKESFEGLLQECHVKWSVFLKERSINEKTMKSHYTHKRLRSAYRSLKTNSRWLFTWYDHIELGIPNTTNALEDHFSDLKNKLRNHNGLSLNRKMKFINEFLKA